MSYYENEPSWPAPARQPSWEQQQQQQQNLSRSSTVSAISSPADANAFAAQFEEIERATDNLMKSGKWYPGQSHAMGGGRRDGGGGSGNHMGRGFDHSADPRMGGGGSGSGSSRHQSVSDFDAGRPGSSGLQGFYQGQRFPGGRQSEAEQMLQAKRRMAAQRERELRNYHQEQQYNRGGKSDRSMSPNTMSEEDRRDLIARQHRALYGETSTMYGQDGTTQRPPAQDGRIPSGGRGPSPLAFDPYGVQAQTGTDSTVQMPTREQADSTTSPTPSQQPYNNMLNDPSQTNRTSNSSPGTSPPLAQNPKGGAAGVAPIGTRPTPISTGTGGLNKRSTTPLTPSSLSHGISVDPKDERSTSASSNPGMTAEKSVPGLGGWGSNSGVWGSGKNSLAVQPSSVWG